MLYSVSGQCEFVCVIVYVYNNVLIMLLRLYVVSFEFVIDMFNLFVVSIVGSQLNVVYMVSRYMKNVYYSVIVLCVWLFVNSVLKLLWLFGVWVFFVLVNMVFGVIGCCICVSSVLSFGQCVGCCVRQCGDLGNVCISMKLSMSGNVLFVKNSLCQLQCGSILCVNRLVSILLSGMQMIVVVIIIVWCCVGVYLVVIVVVVGNVLLILSLV